MSIFRPNCKTPAKASAPVSVTLQFDESGKLQAVLLTAQSDIDEALLVETLYRHFRPRHLLLIQRLLRRCHGQ
jgi:hypothetical protein